MVDSETLLQYVERLERVNEELASVKEDIKSILNEAKASGFDPKYVKQMVKLRAMSKDKVYEEDELTKAYRNALGI